MNQAFNNHANKNKNIKLQTSNFKQFYVKHLRVYNSNNVEQFIHINLQILQY